MLRSTTRVRQSLSQIRLFPSVIKPSSIFQTTAAKTIPKIAANRIFSRQLSSERGVLALIDAVQRNDHTTIDQIAQHTPRMIVEQTSNDNTALHEAARIGDVAMIEKLSKAFSLNFNVNHKCHCYKRRTPLAYAVEGGHIDAVNKLLSLGADPNITDEKGWTALDYAIAGIKTGKNKVVFEKISLSLQQHHGTAKQFLLEEREMLRELKINTGLNQFFEDYKVSARQKVEISHKQFIEERKKLTSGKL